MRKKIFTGLIVASLLFTTGFSSVAFDRPTEDTMTTSEVYIPSETSPRLTAGVTAVIEDSLNDVEIAPIIEEVQAPLVTASYQEETAITLETTNHERVDTSDKEELKSLIKDCKKRVKASKNIAKGCEALEYDENHPVVVLADQEWANAKDDLKYYQDKYDGIIEQEKKDAEIKKWADKSNEYPVATKIWQYLKDKSYSDYVVAGILGNMMAEVGGQTLDIQPNLGNGMYYGICQWRIKYMTTNISGAGLERQLQYLTDTIKSEFNTFGNCYYRGFTYDAFCNLSNERDAALAFAKVYERCGSGSYSVRQKNATTAYEYFTK